jgi:N-acetylglutamate synthase-like GNAT family acetyltransferase
MVDFKLKENLTGLVREATRQDAAAIKLLLKQLDYPTGNGFVEQKLDTLLIHPEHYVFVYELEGKVAGFVSMHMVPQIALAGDFAIIGYLSVDEKYLHKGIGKQLELHCTQLARERKCDRIQLHCHIRRLDAHRFYEGRGYNETRKYYTKQVRYNEDI